MSKEASLQSKIIIETLDQFPNAYSNTLAQLIYDKNPILFKDKERVRSLIRYYRGANGDNLRNRVSDKSRFRIYDEKKDNPFGIPESYADDYPNFNIHIQYNKALIIADSHIPYHDIKAINIALEKGVKDGCKAILLNGDIIDCYQGSKWERDPRNRTIAQEFDALESFIKILSKHFKVYYKLGNHEERFQSVLRIKAPMLIGVPEFEISNILKGRGCDCEVIYKQKIYFGKLPVIHGHEYGIKASVAVNTARSLFLKTNKSAACAHSHRTSEHSDKSIDDKTISCFSIGCMCNMNPEYAVLNKWNQGFAEVEFDSSGYFEFRNYRVDNGKIY